MFMKRKKGKQNFMTSHVKDVVGSAVTLGVGSSILGGMGQGAIATKVVTPGANMLGVAATAGMGMGIMNMANKYSKGGKAVKVKKGKHVGYGEW